MPSERGRFRRRLSTSRRFCSSFSRDFRNHAQGMGICVRAVELTRRKRYRELTPDPLNYNVQDPGQQQAVGAGSCLEAQSDLGQAQQNADQAAGSKRCPHCRLCKTSTTNCSLGFLLKFHGRRQQGHFHNNEPHMHSPCHAYRLLVK
jgi:hypothetical protein